MFQYFALFLKF